MSNKESSLLESAIRKTGGEYFSEIRKDRFSFMDSRAYTSKLMAWAMKDAQFRVALFRFVDVLPALQDSRSVISHAQAYFRPVADKVPGILQWGLNLHADGVRARASAALIRSQIESLGKQFIIGSTPAAAVAKLEKMYRNGLHSTVDLLGEACVSEHEAEVYLQRYLELIDELYDRIPVNISVKLSALYPNIKPVGFDRSVKNLSDRLRIIFRHAREKRAFVYVDMEDSTKTDMTLAVVRKLLMEDAFHDWKDVGIVLQTYLRRTESDLEQVIQWLRDRGSGISIRLVKGAYWDTETILAKLASWPIPVWQEKHSSDAAYERCSKVLLDNCDLIRPAFASHNLRSLVHAIEYARMNRISRKQYEIQTLFGMADPLNNVLLKNGLRVREYAPIGDMLTGMAYLVRRLLENTANEGFIRTGYLEDESVDKLMEKPSDEVRDNGSQHLAPDPRDCFMNAPLLDFTQQQNRDTIGKELEAMGIRKTGDYPRILPLIGGLEVKDCQHYMPTDCPEDVSIVLATIGMAEKVHVDRAVESLRKGFIKWRSTNWNQRAEVLFNAADIMQRKRFELASHIILESGKPWVEADADVAEAMDFCRYYGHRARELGNPVDCCKLDGEEDFLVYEPRGVCGVIAPWNFPLAIPCGMMSAALVTGNTVILKPAEQSTLVAWELFQIFLEAGMPVDAGAFLPGKGEVVGSALVEHPLIETIAFTGSKTVGMEIIRKAAILRDGQVHVKRVIAEMGGKNAIVVDDGADLDQAVKGIIYSAFGYAGQKCSACSRLYAHAAIYDRLLDRLKEAVMSQVTREASDPSADLGPVIDVDAQTRINKAISSSKNPCVQGQIPDRLPDGRYFPATLFYDVPFDDPLMEHELFGPVLAMAKVKSFEEGITCANDSKYALTGAVFSRHPEHLRLAAREFRVGNLYLNRGCTGALVARQPFGGAAHSGVGSKAGGPDYLKQFLIPRLVSENTIRQGFAPMQGESTE